MKLLQPRHLDVWIMRPLENRNRYLVFFDANREFSPEFGAPKLSARTWLVENGNEHANGLFDVYTSGIVHDRWGRWKWDESGACWRAEDESVRMPANDLIRYEGQVGDHARYQVRWL